MAMRSLLVVTVMAAVALIAAAPPAEDAQARTTVALALQAPPTAALAVTGTQQLVSAADRLVTQSPTSLTAAVEPLVVAGGGSVGVTLMELDGAAPLDWSYDGGDVFTAASTYKLAVLMLEAQNIAAGATDPSGLVCYQDSDYEDGWFDDYVDGMCLTRTGLAQRAGLYSDNTAGHMLVRDVGGADVLNAVKKTDSVAPADAAHVKLSAARPHRRGSIRS